MLIEEYRGTIITSKSPYVDKEFLEDRDLVDGMMKLILGRNNGGITSYKRSPLMGATIVQSYTVNDELAIPILEDFFHGSVYEKIVPEGAKSLSAIIKADGSKLFQLKPNVEIKPDIVLGVVSQFEDEEDLKTFRLLFNIICGDYIPYRLGNEILILKDTTKLKSNCTFYELLSTPFYVNVCSLKEALGYGSMNIIEFLFSVMLPSEFKRYMNPLLIPKNNIESFCYIVSTLYNKYGVQLPKVNKTGVAFPVNHNIFDNPNSTIVNLFAASRIGTPLFPIESLAYIIETHEEFVKCLSNLVPIDLSKFVDYFIDRYSDTVYMPTYVIDTDGSHIYTDGINILKVRDGRDFAIQDFVISDYVDYYRNDGKFMDEPISLLKERAVHDAILNKTLPKKVFKSRYYNRIAEILALISEV